MSLKKTFIAIGLVAIVAVSVIVLVLLSQKKETGLQEPAQNQQSAIPAVLPFKTESSESQENVEKARKIFENITQESISDKTKKDGLKLIAFENQKGSPIPLSDFEKALGVEINPKIQEYLNNGYQIFYCPGSGEKKEFGVFLNYNQEKVFIGFSYDVLDMMKDWENTIFPDLHASLYPNINFSEEKLSQKIEFREGKYRYAGVNLPGGEKSSIQYQAVGDGIIIATSLSCLDNLYQHFEPTDP